MNEVVATLVKAALQSCKEYIMYTVLWQTGNVPSVSNHPIQVQMATNSKPPELPHLMLLSEAIKCMNPDLLDRAMLGMRRHPSLDHPTHRIDTTGSARRDVTPHGAALSNFFGLVHAFLASSESVESIAAIRSAATVCRKLIDAKAPIFSAAVGTGLEDDYTYAASMFTRHVWPARIEGLISGLFDAYVVSGNIDVDATFDCEYSILGGRLFVDGAIKYGNGAAAAASIRHGCNMTGFATDSMGRAIDLMDYVRATTQGRREEMVAIVAKAMMVRKLTEAAPTSAPTLVVQPAPNRRTRARV